MTKVSRGRARRVAKWVGLVACAVLAGSWAASLRWTGGWRGERVVESSAYQFTFAGIAEGSFFIAHDEGFFERYPPMLLGWHSYRLLRYPDEPLAVFGRCHFVLGDSSTRLSVPLWMLLALMVVPTSILWYVDRAAARRRRAGLCVKCGYDRAGLDAAAVCPECGAAARGA